MISVIVPYWNAAGWIARCAESLVQQDGDLEFLFVNDDSDDDSEAILEGYADDRFRLLQNEDAGGVSGARNTGLVHAQGDWITFLDADDEMLPDLEERFYCMRAEADADVYQANHFRIYDETGRLALKYVNAAGWYGLDGPPLEWCMVWNKFYKRDVLSGIWFNTDLQYGEDELFNLGVLAQARRIYCVMDRTMRRHFGNKKSLSHIRSEGDLLRQTDALIEFLKDSKDPEARRLVLSVLSEHFGSKTYKKVFCK